jgi:hypothetical protein
MDELSGNYAMTNCPKCKDKVGAMLSYNNEPVMWYCSTCEKSFMRECVVGSGILGIPKDSKVEVI